MKQIYLIVALSLLCNMTTFTSCQPKEDVKPDEKKSSIVILYENDVHCAIDGYAKMAGLRDAISDTAYVGLTSSGDYLMGGTAGALSTGSYIVDIMRTMHYDALGLGNHEFDFGGPRMLELLKGFNAPVICANFFDMQGKRFFPAYTIREYGKRKIAFVGVLTPKTMEDESYSFYDEKGNQLYDLKQSELPQLVQQAVDEVRQAGADYVILL
jgi:2',3'-cyclic-nucleotide 2'-phosphodiesterase (5'-nucleotidase family)